MGDSMAGRTLSLPATLAGGLLTLTISNEPFRVLVKTIEDGQRIAVAQETGIRDKIARASALRTLMPILILVPSLLLIVANLVRNMFRPVAMLAKDIDQRAEQMLHPIENVQLPVELQPFVVAINRLLSRVTQSMDTQRRFVADAAHELRSPLTALSLQAERLAQIELPNEARDRLTALQRSIARGRNLLDQLLTLAKVQSLPDLPTTPVSVQAIYRRVLEDLLPLAEAKRIDIGVEGSHDVQVLVSELDMIAVVKNLVDNAIRYTPSGGRIDRSVSTDAGQAVVTIDDNGPGIPRLDWPLLKQLF